MTLLETLDAWPSLAVVLPVMVLLLLRRKRPPGSKFQQMLAMTLRVK